MSQESAGSATAAMDNMLVDEMQPMRSDSELLAAAADLDAEIESNKDKAGSGLGSGSGVPEGNPVGVDTTGKGGSDDSDIFSSSEENEEDEEEAAAAVRAKLIKDTIKDGAHSGITVKPLAAELYVDNVDLLNENGWKTILDFVIEDNKKTLYKKHVEAAIYSCKAGLMPERASTQDFFDEEEEEEEEDEEDNDYNLKELSQTKLVSMLGECNGKIEMIVEKMTSDPVKMVLKEFASGFKGKAADDMSRAKEIVSEMKNYIKSKEFNEMSSEKRDLMINVLSAMREKSDVLPVQLKLEKAEKERLEEIVKQKALDDAMAKVDKATSKRVAQASGSSSKRRK